MTITADQPTTATERLVAALQDPDFLFTRDQVAHLMASAARWARESADGEPDDLTYRAGFLDGVRAAEAAQNEAYRRELSTPVFVAGEWVAAGERHAARQRADRDAHRRHRGDYRGGPVEVW